MEVIDGVGQGGPIPDASGGRFIILLPGDEDNDRTSIPGDLVATSSFLRIAKRLGCEERMAFHYLP